MTQVLPIVVAGGGIGGLAAAYVLAQDGHPVTVLEQSGAFGETGAGIQPGPNIFKMFNYLGLTDAARAAYGFPYGVIYRADSHQVFLDACKAPPSNVTLRTHAKYRAVLKREDVPAHLWNDDILLWGGERTHLVTYPLRRGELYNLVAVFHSNKYDEGWNTFGDIAELNQRFADVCPQVKDLLAKIEARFYGDIYHAAGVQRQLRNRMFQSGTESAGFAGLKWMYDGIDPKNLFH